MNHTTLFSTFRRLLNRRSLSALGAACALGFTAAEAGAALLCAPGNINPQVGGAGAVLLDLNSFAAGVQPTLFFNSNAPVRGRIIFNAECSIAGGPTNWVNVDILVGGVLAVPSNSDNAFCSGNHTATENDGWVSATTQVSATFPAGVTPIQVRVNGVGVVPNWRIDDLSLCVDTM